MAAITKAAFLRCAKLRVAQLGGGATVRSVIESIALGHFTSSVINGETIVSTSRDGVSVSVVFPDGMSPADLVNMASEVLEWIERQPDPNNPGNMESVRRLRVCFNRGAY